MNASDAKTTEPSTSKWEVSKRDGEDGTWRYQTTDWDHCTDLLDMPDRETADREAASLLGDWLTGNNETTGVWALTVRTDDEQGQILAEGVVDLDGTEN